MVASPPVALTKGVASETMDFTATQALSRAALSRTSHAFYNREYAELNPSPLLSASPPLQRFHPLPHLSLLVHLLPTIFYLFCSSTFNYFFRFFCFFPFLSKFSFLYFPYFLLFSMLHSPTSLPFHYLPSRLPLGQLVRSFETGSRKEPLRLDSTEFKLSGHRAVRGNDA